jgi:8-oxo-dGTP diphosphatase
MRKELFSQPYQGTDVGYVLLIVRSGDKVVVIRKNRPAWQAGKFNFPGGKIEKGETPAQAAARELIEETGMVVPESALRPVVLMVREGDFEIFVFAVDFKELPEVASLTDEPVSLLETGNLAGEQCLDSLAWLYGLAFSGIEKVARVEFEPLPAA